MITFVIPLISPELSPDWGLTCRLFTRTLRSVLNQSDGSLRVVVVCHRRPESSLLLDKRVVVEVVKYPTTLNVRDARFHDDERTEICETDKGRKLLRGTLLSRELGTDHVMFVDADDCISRRIAALVHRQPDCPGWKIERGYSYFESASFVRYKPHGFHRQCGTGLIVRPDLLPYPAERYDRGLRYYRAFLGHDHRADDLRRTGQRLVTVPFPAAVYVYHAQNMRARRLAADCPFWRRAASSVRGLLLWRRLTEEINREFQLYPLTQDEPRHPHEARHAPARVTPATLPLSARR